MPSFQRNTFRSRRRLLRSTMGVATAVAAGSLSWTSSVIGQTFPSRPIRVIVPFGPGGATDLIARTVTQAVAERLGQSIIVENKAGASGNIGAAQVARAEPDGHTLLVATSSHAVNQTLFRHLNYDLLRDFAGLSNMASVPLLLVVNPSVPAKTARELADHAKASPNGLNYASGSVGTAAHLAGAQFSTLTGGRMTHVAYKGGAQATQDLVGGQVQLMFANLPEVLSQVQAGRLRPIALTGDHRHSALPEVPTFAEAGFPDVRAQSWFALFAPAATPAPVLDTLSDAISAAIATDAVRARLIAAGAQPIGDRRDTFQPFVAAEVERWGKLVKASGATAD